MERIDGQQFRQMILLGAKNLKKHAEYVDSLNVFPVPDGDTGTNMNLSMSSGADEVKDIKFTHVGDVGKHFSKGLLMGARGNSGVILSQLFRGFSKHVEEVETLDKYSFVEALNAGVKTAYKAVMKPVEGTILTVAKDSANKAVESVESVSDIVELMKVVVEESKASLKRTPDLLPVLKEVGVVDSGGQGLVYVYEGFLSALTGEEIVEEENSVDTEEFINDTHEFDSFMTAEDITFGFCTEFMVRFEDGKKEFVEEEFRNDMDKFGDSLLVINDEEIVKVHVHTEKPGKALTYGAEYGEIIKIKVENMREQFRAIEDNREVKEETNEQIETAVIAVSSGEGINEMLRSIGVTHIINGGQTMNPSTEDIINIIKGEDVKEVIIMPNNKNIIMAAEQAQELLEIPSIVIPTRSIPECISAMFAYTKDASLEANEDDMIEAIQHVKTGQITYSVRDTKIDEIDIKKDQHMGILDGKIVTSNDADKETLDILIRKMIDEDTEIMAIFVGEDGNNDTLDSVLEKIEEEFDDVEFEIHDGKQPVYSYLISAE
ncbi:DAK2 domain-containing protein [Phocicoccus pinnipedialis]|uniref:Dihydroxyacetone kinase subunit DhaL n=1 Tax=Phocicoccus pinnipedialis TaxID=110845 RepID=A0A6V7RHT2_9BACL|nr:DAK2 domain-containing protein [Jeotgalicoccus pinnipedialis]MBP1939079.1 DAK2 domain fusion protein YloV [Jeotgalicoccus pinnipedialis]CAD2076893.1 dihydroxyacetone kinase subunit DhaL [Jeotgalicoccus pinnipedialis]